MKDYTLDIEFGVGRDFFFLSALNDIMPISSHHYFWWEASCNYYFLIWNKSSHPLFWSPICFQDFLFLFVFSNLTITCLSIDFSVFSLFGVCSSYTCELMPFNTFGKVSTIIFKKFSSVALSLLLWNPNCMCVCLVCVVNISLQIISFVFSSYSWCHFSFCAQNWIWISLNKNTITLYWILKNFRVMNVQHIKLASIYMPLSTFK